MTKSEKTSIVNRVNWIHKNRSAIKEREGEVNKIRNNITEIAKETIDIVDKLKIDMGDQTTMNIRIEGKFYTLTQNGNGVEIEALIIEIES